MLKVIASAMTRGANWRQDSMRNVQRSDAVMCGIGDQSIRTGRRMSEKAFLKEFNSMQKFLNRLDAEAKAEIVAFMFQYGVQFAADILATHYRKHDGDVKARNVALDVLRSWVEISTELMNTF